MPVRTSPVMAMMIRTVSTFTFNGFFSVVDGFCFPADDVSVFCVDLKFILYLRIVGFPFIKRYAVVIVRMDVDVSGINARDFVHDGLFCCLDGNAALCCLRCAGRVLGICRAIL